ncbi:MAG: hypothetical protein JNJ77_15610 [Planctomycetia bacterium]|nr:hypothetical protein [Planctomycetia bacterium]
MNAEWQWFLTMLCIVLAVAYCLLRSWKSWRNLRSGGCGNTCGCQGKPPNNHSIPFIDSQAITSKIRNRQQNTAVHS